MTDQLGPTRLRDLLGYAAGVALVAWLALRRWYGDIPGLTWFVPLSLLLLAVAETLAANDLRARIRGARDAPPLRPLVAARMLALAKASSLVGAVMLGIWAGLLVYVLPKRDFLAAARTDTATGLVGVGCAAALIAAALWLEFSCRAPTPPDRDTSIRPDGA